MEGVNASKAILLAACITAFGGMVAAVITNLDDDGGSGATPTVAESATTGKDETPEPNEGGEAASEEGGGAAGAEGSPSQPPTSLSRTSIVELSEMGKADHLGPSEGDYGTQSIGGHPYPNGVSMLVYSGGTGISKLAIFTEGQFSTISGVVGIDDSAPCIEVSALVSITDDRGSQLWGPKTVRARSRVPFSADLGGAVRIYLTQASLEGSEEYCGANPAWGNVYLTGRPAGA